LLEKVDLSLIMSQLMFISISDGKLAINRGFELRAKVEKCIFTSFLMGFTIQDGSTRERSDDMTIVICFFIIQIKRNKNKGIIISRKIKRV